MQSIPPQGGGGEESEPPSYFPIRFSAVVRDIRLTCYVCIPASLEDSSRTRRVQEAEWSSQGR